MQQPPFRTPEYVPAPPLAPHKSGIPGWLVVLIAVVGAVLLLGGGLVGLALYNVRLAMAAAKTAEAKSNVGALSRAAVAAYERESYDDHERLSHRLCETASPVPAKVPRGTRYLPSTVASLDFDTGSPVAGWKCLKFALTSPISYRYSYAQGAGYLVPSIAPGVNGFEAAAQGDLDGDGEPSTFARTGQIDANETLVLSTTLYTEKENE